MRIGVLADTHVNSIDELPRDMMDNLRRTDLIIHLGDYDNKELIYQLNRLGDFYGITGNHDGPEIRSLLPEQAILNVNGKRLGLVHGHGCVMPLGFKSGLLKRFRGQHIDALLYGHTHVIKNTVRSGVLFFNPGSAMGKFPSYGKTYGILNISDTIHGEVFYIREAGNVVSVPRFAFPWLAKPALQKVPVYNPYTRS
jgi:putative phosphoesterase